MPGLDELKAFYSAFDWRFTEAAWSNRWGGTDVQWFGTILPRIQAFLPARSALEIGPGHGRLSHYLRRHCGRLDLADMDPGAVEACRQRFADDSGVRVNLIDGCGLNQLGPGRFDFVFSVFSLVHADIQTMRAYIADLATRLEQDGVAFLHHSNAAELCSGDAEKDARLNCYRHISVSAATVARAATDAGLSCCGQEVFGWDSDEAFTDCFSIITPRYSKWDHTHRCIENADFCAEVEQLKRLARLYGRRAPSM
jgi:2-polyprenyl-3-methyl-5-hydroxy-6-metoxy-1,4-benzoquinol methylase